jgi:DNA-binding winged helix-turn-helix (wHTH) protein/tetratricopeptide (TPR) repeat protein/TolB-like protein
MQGTDSCPRTFSFGVFELDLRAAELRKRGVRIKLQDQPFQILSVLLEHAGNIVTREQLRQKLWPAHTFVDFDRSLNKAMTKLRSALGDSAENPRYVETIPRHGYRFLAPVHTRREDPAATTAEHSSLPDEQAFQQVLPQREPPHADPRFASQHWPPHIGRKQFYGTVATVVLALLVTLAYLRIHQPMIVGGALTMVSPRRSVAVLGFKNLSGDTQESWLSTALSDWLMTELTAGEQLRAIPAESVARMEMELSLSDVDSLGRDSLLRIRKNLATDFVVVGSYAMFGSKSDGQIRLDLRLQDTRSGETACAISEAGTESHLLDLVSRAGEQLREKLGVRAVTREEAAQVAIALPSRADTAKLYAEGLTKLRVFDALTAQDLLSKAVAAEPNYALSHAALSTAWQQLGYDERASAEAKKAFDLSSNLSRAEHLLVEGRYREASRDWVRAIEIYRALFDFFPDNLDYGLALAEAQLSANRWKDSLDTIAALRTLPAPLRDDGRIDLAENAASRSLGDMKRAGVALARAAETAHSAGAYLLLAKARREQAWLFENSGKQQEAEAAVREAKQLYVAANFRPGVAGAATLEAIALERQGDYLGAKKKYEEALAIYRESGNKLSLSNEYDNLGDILLYLGDLAAARKSYEEALAMYREIGDQNGLALAKLGIGDVFLALGKHIQAKGLYEEAQEICRQLGNRSRQASALSDLARVHRLEGDMTTAWKNETEAVTTFEAVGDKSEVAHVRLQLAELLMDEGKNVEAAAVARQAESVFEAAKAARYGAEANLVLSKALLGQGQVAESRKVVAQVIAAATESHYKELELKSAIVAARVQTASGSLDDLAESTRQLNRVLVDATAAGFLDLAFDARLALGEIEMGSTAGRARLAALEKDSANAGVLLIARRATALLRMRSNGTTN